MPLVNYHDYSSDEDEDDLPHPALTLNLLGPRNDVPESAMSYEHPRMFADQFPNRTVSDTGLSSSPAPPVVNSNHVVPPVGPSQTSSPKPSVAPASSGLVDGRISALSGASDHPRLLERLMDLKTRNGPMLSQQEALQLAIDATELSMQFMRIASDKTERKDRMDATYAFMDQAERIKRAEDWDASKVENLIDLEPLEMNGSMSVPQVASPAPAASNQLELLDTSGANDLSELVDSPAANDRPQQTPSSTPSPLKVDRTSQSPSPPAAIEQSGQPPSRGRSPPKQASPRPTSLPRHVSAARDPIDCRQLPQQEEILLWRASKMTGGPFPPWRPGDVSFAKSSLPPSSMPYTDATPFRLSVEQSKILDGWKRPSEALPPPFSRVATPDAPAAVDGPTMIVAGQIDLVQEAASDCSVVASMSACIAREARGFPQLLWQAFSAPGTVPEAPTISLNGKYSLRLNFNGCIRKVIIDDRLPVSKNARLLHVIDRNNPTLLWPALLEKSYLKLRGGYDFPGSNSGTDLWILTGWIPEQLFLHTENEVDIDQVWERIRTGFHYGDLLITAGTSEISPKTQKALGLVGFHDYAVLDIKEEQGRRLLLIKNPWVNGTSWRASEDRDQEQGLQDTNPRAVSNSHSEDTSDSNATVVAAESQTTAQEATPLRAGTFWMPIDDVIQNFSTLYLNWNPGLFKYRCEVHFPWNLVIDRSPFKSFQSNPQFKVTCDMNDQVWLVLEKHFTDVSSDGQKPEYISLFAFQNEGHRVTLNKGAMAQLPFIDSPQTTMRIDMEGLSPMTVVVAEQQLESSTHTFTLRAFSSYPLSITRAKAAFADSVAASGAWTLDTCGGRPGSALYSKNPQFALHLPSASRVSVLLETLEEGPSVHVKLLHGRGKRVLSVMKQDIIIDSGTHSKSCAYAEMRGREKLDAGDYTIVCNTYESNTFGKFKLHVASNVNASLNPIKRDGAGRLQLRLSDATFAPGVRVVSAPIEPLRLTKLRVSLKLVTPKDRPPVETSSPIRLTVEYGAGPNRQILIASGSGMFVEAAEELYTEDFELAPIPKKAKVAGLGYWMSIERMPGAQDSLVESFHVTAWPDNADWARLGVWRAMDG